MLTFDVNSGNPNSSCNCDCGVPLVDTEPFPGAKGGTLKCRLCPISLSTTWLPWKQKWCQTFLFLIRHAAAAFGSCLDKGRAGHRKAIHVKMTMFWWYKLLQQYSLEIVWDRNCAYSAFSAIAERYAQIIYSLWRPSSLYRCSHLITKLHSLTLC